MKGLHSNNVEEVQWWFGDLFTLLCENKEIVDPLIYNEISDIKNKLVNSVSTVLFFNTRFRKPKELEIQLKKVVNSVEERLADLRLFLQNCEVL